MNTVHIDEQPTYLCRSVSCLYPSQVCWTIFRQPCSPDPLVTQKTVFRPDRFSSIVLRCKKQTGSNWIFRTCCSAASIKIKTKCLSTLARKTKASMADTYNNEQKSLIVYTVPWGTDWETKIYLNDN